MIDLNVLEVCKNKQIEDAMDMWKNEIQALALELDVSFHEIEKQVRLHLPLFEFVDKNLSYLPIELKTIVCNRFINYNSFYNKYLELSGSKALINLQTTIIGEHICFQKKPLLPITFEAVKKDIGIEIESKLHYLRQPRMNSRSCFGIFIKGYTYPICYMSFCAVDRDYQLITLNKVLDLNEKELYSHEVFQLARVYGFGNLPRCSISMLTAYSCKQLELMGVEYIITAINPCIGFMGSSMIASGFKPFAYSQVGYFYDKNGEYINRRSAINYSKKPLIDMPPNLLLVKGINKSAKKKVSMITKVLTIEPELYHNINESIDEDLSDLRQTLEKSWNTLTAYHGTPTSAIDPISKGQCGVTTAYLAKKFENFNALFCEGDTYFPNEKGISNHCWLKIPYFEKNGSIYLNIIIDLTADQNGFSKAIICDTEQNLKNRLVFYNAKNEVDAATIDSSGLLNRLNILKSQIDDTLRK